MSLPGTRLRSLAARVCRATTMERFIDPTIADLQAEYAAALLSGSAWRRQRTLLFGYIAFAKVLLWCTAPAVAHAWSNWSFEDRRGLVRVVWRSVVAVIGVTLPIWLLELPRTRQMLDDNGSAAGIPEAMAYLLPSILPLSVPVGLAIGAALGAHGRALSRRLTSAILLVAVAVSFASLVTIAWVLPAANQFYREAILRGTATSGRTLYKGERELTLSELRHRLRGADRQHSNRILFEFHTRLGLAGAPLTFAAFALVITIRRRSRKRRVLAAIGVAAFGYLMVLWMGNAISESDTQSPQLSAWMPQIALVLTTIVVAVPRTIIRTRA
jgi:lipopolysaccharide export LptBFGC system permease protein LptF